MRAPVATLLLCAVGCSTPAPSPHAPTPPRAAPAGRADASELRSACDDLDRFRALSLRGADRSERAALERWSPPRPVAAADRPAVEAVVRRWTELCAEAEAVELASRLIALPTVSAEQSPADGPAFRDMAQLLSRWAADAGLGFRVVGANDAWEISLGTGPRTVGYVLHADVVPAAEPSEEDDRPTTAVPPGWSVPPFAAQVRDGRLWGRGAEDDKGPIAAVLVVLRLLARAGLTPDGRVLAILGTGEENDWDGMRRYADAEPHPRFVVSLDANFPVVVAEDGFVAFRIAAPLGARRARRARGPSKARAVDARGGAFLTQVPGDARLVLEPATDETIDALLARASEAAAAESARPGSFDATATREGDRVLVRVQGRAVHSSIAEEGDNALWALAGVAARLDLAPGGIADVLRVVHEYLDGDHWGEKLGLAYEHPLMGKLLVAPTLLRVEEGRAVLGINMRRPAGRTSPEFSALLDGVLARLRREISPRLQEVGERYVGEPHLGDTSGPLVDTLLDVYRAHGGEADARPVSIRGGTYARLFPGAVSFGPEWPGHGYRGHAPDEWMEVAALGRYARMILDATLRLDPQAPPPGP